MEGREAGEEWEKQLGRGRWNYCKILITFSAMIPSLQLQEQPLPLSAPGFRMRKTANQLVLMQQGPAGGLAGEVPRTVTSHILRNLPLLAEILMDLGYVCVGLCMYKRERKFTLLSFFCVSHTLLQIPTFSYVYTWKVASVTLCRSARKETWFWQQDLSVRYCWSLSHLPDHLWRGIKSQKLFNQAFKLSYCLTSWAQLVLLSL